MGLMGRLVVRGLPFLDPMGSSIMTLLDLLGLVGQGHPVLKNMTSSSGMMNATQY